MTLRKEPQKAEMTSPAFHRGLGPFDSVILVVGIMISSCICKPLITGYLKAFL
jgi:hypothetical protein